MNIKLSYLYRDAGNYKNYNDVIFSNPQNIPIEAVAASIESNLIEGLWFDATKWQVPDLHFKGEPWNNELDHHWHELENIEETTEAPNTSLAVNHLLNIIK